MKNNRNEDKFGIIEDKNFLFDSIEKATNYVRGLKDKLKRKAKMEEFPITDHSPESMNRYIEYGLSLMTKTNLPLHKPEDIVRARALLWLRSRGNSFESIARYLSKHGQGTNPQKVELRHRDSMKMIKEAIARVQNKCTPILGG